MASVDLRDRRVSLPPPVRGPRGVRGGAGKRMPELDTGAELAQACLFGGCPRVRADPLQLSGPPHHGGLTEWIGRCDEQQPLGLAGSAASRRRKLASIPLESTETEPAPTRQAPWRSGPGELE